MTLAQTQHGAAHLNYFALKGAGFSFAWGSCQDAHVWQQSEKHLLASYLLPLACLQVWQEEGENSTLVGIVRLHVEQEKLCEALSGADNGAPICEGACHAVRPASDPSLQQAAVGRAACSLQPAGCSGLHLSCKQQQMLFLPFY